MTTLKLSPNASGAGSFTIAAPSTSSDFTLNLPSTLGTNNGSALVSTDASGNLGLGVTPSAWGGSSRGVIDLGIAGAVMASTSVGTATAYNAYFDGTNWIYKTSAGATRYTSTSTSHFWYTAPSGTAGNAISFTQAMTLDASGNLGVATTTPATYGKLAVRGGITVSAGTTSLTGTSFFASDAANSSFWINHSSANTNLVSDSPLTFWGPSGSGVAERARIDSSGNVMIAKTALNAAVAGIELRANGDSYFSRTDSTNSQSTLGVYSTGAGAYRFYVGMGGTVYATSTTISAISDIRFKENVRDLDAGLAEVMALKPRLYDWKEGKGANTKNARGFIAQEFEQVFPDLIDEWKDPAPEGEEPYKSVRQDLIPVLVKAIQEQQTLIQDQLAIINTQQTELEQLKAQLTSVSADVAALKGAK